MNRSRTVVAFISAALLGTSTLTAYPISPVPLWDLVQKSDLVVLADVVKVNEDDVITDPSPEDANAIEAYLNQDGVADLHVIEAWKYEPGATVRVRFPRFLICPAPPKYVEGRVVLAFLIKGEKGWETTGLSYGTLYPAQTDIDDFRSLVTEAVALQDNPPVGVADMMDWHVRAASLPGPRWHGLYALVPEADDLHYYYDQREKGLRLAGVPTTGQLRQIADGFIRSPSTDRTLPMVLALLRGFRGREIDLAAVSAIERLLDDGQPPWWIKSALYLTLERFDDPDPGARLLPLGETFSDMTSEQVRSVWEEARRSLAIPEVPPARRHEEDVRGVGSNTPS